MNCIQKQQLVSFPKVRIWKPWFRHFNNHKEFHNEGTVHLFSLMALFSYANFRSNERMISGARYMEAPGQWICKLGSLPRILRVHSKRQALEQLDYYEKYGFLTYEWLDEENEIIRFSITNWKEHCTSLQYNYYSYKGSGFFFFPLPVGRMLLRIAHKTEGIVFSELDAITGPDFNVIRLGKVRKVACKCVEQSFEVGVDSGQAGFFDDAFYQNDTVFEELPAPGFAIGDLWYRHVCDITLSKMSAGVLPYGAVSSSGFGDGGYTCYTHADENGVIDFAFIVFI